MGGLGMNILIYAGIIQNNFIKFNLLKRFIQLFIVIFPPVPYDKQINFGQLELTLLSLRP